MELNPYLNFDGQCAAAFKFYERVLGGKIIAMMTGADMPGGGMGKEWEGKIIHARLQVGDKLLMGSDSPPKQFESAKGFHVTLGIATPAEAERVFKALSAGRKVTMPIQETFWAQRFGMLVDKFGTPWMINCEKAQDSKAAAGSGKTAKKSSAKPKKSAAANGQGNGAFVISRTFDAPKDVVFAAFTEPERMREWWGPKGFKVIASKMDLRPGGTYHYGLRAPDGSKMWGKFIYREIVPREKLVFVNSFSDAKGGTTRHPMNPDWPLELLSTFSFAEKGGRTTFTVTWSPLNPSREERATFDGSHQSMQGGWSGTMDQLASYLTKA